MTDKQIEASRLNGAKSRGPLSIEGAEWRVRRAWSLISALIDNNSDKMAADVDSEYASIDEVTRTALAHDFSLPNTHSIRELESHVARYSRQCDRALRRLKDIRSLSARNRTPSVSAGASETAPNRTPSVSAGAGEMLGSNKNTENEPG